MKLQDVFDQLGFGEFSQLAIGGQPAGQINENNFKQVLAHVNLGLTTLYRRFNLKQAEIGIALTPGKTMYPITSTYAVSNTRSREAVRHVLDSAALPFQDDIHKILGVKTEFGINMALNDGANEYSCSTPTLTTLVVPDKVANQDSNTPYWLRIARVNVVYQANHPVLAVPIGFFDPARVSIELPPSHLEALLYFIASRVHNPIGMSNEFHAGNNYAAKFEQVCQQLEASGMEVDSDNTNTRARQKGFV